MHQTLSILCAVVSAAGFIVAAIRASQKAARNEVIKDVVIGVVFGLIAIGWLFRS